MIRRGFDYSRFYVSGWHSSRKLVVLQSDDWGSERMPTAQAQKALDKNPYVDVSDPYNRLDTIAGEDDLSALYETLESVTDCHGNPACMTANVIVANPDYERIVDSVYMEYHRIYLDKYLEKHNKIHLLQIWKEGIQNGLFVPQFHGLEHTNVPHLMESLENNIPGVKECVSIGVFGANYIQLPGLKKNFQAAWEARNSSEDKTNCDRIQMGLKKFEEIFGFPSVTATPPSYTWTQNNTKQLLDSGVESIQTIMYQKEPVYGAKQYSRVFHRTTYRDLGMSTQARNVFFEPALQGYDDLLGSHMKRAKLTFGARKPLIIGTHRLNFIGKYSEENRRQSLQQLKELLCALKAQWPDIEFVSSKELHTIMKSD